MIFMKHKSNKIRNYIIEFTTIVNGSLGIKANSKKQALEKFEKRQFDGSFKTHKTDLIWGKLKLSKT